MGLQVYEAYKKTNKKAKVMSHEIKSDNNMEQNKNITLKDGVRVEQIYGNHFF